MKALRELVDDSGQAGKFDRLLAAVTPELNDAAERGARPMFLMFALVGLDPRCTRGQAANYRANPPLGSAPRRLIVTGVKAVVDLGAAWLRSAAGLTESEAKRVHLALMSLHRRLLTSDIETLAARIERPRPISPRQQDQLLTACIVCLMRELKDSPKRASVTATLLEKAGLIGRRRSGRSGAGEIRVGAAAVEFVKKRYSWKNREAANNPNKLLGELVTKTSATYNTIVQLTELWSGSNAREFGPGCQGALESSDRATTV